MSQTTEQTKTAESVFADKVNRFLSMSGWTARRLAKSAGISSATLSQFLSNQYPGDCSKVTNQLNTVIERETEKLTQHKASSSFIETSISKRYFDIARAAHLYQEIGVCYSDAGLGKTESAREYVSKFSDTILIEADPGYTATVLFTELYGKLGSGEHRTMHYLFNACVDALKGSGRLLIIDEAEQLPFRALEMVRRLHDKANVGIILAGMHRLLGNIRGLRGDFAQLYSRVGMACKLEKLQESDTKNIVSQLLPGACDLWSVMHQECGANTRRLFKMINRSIHISEVNDRVIDEDVILAASDMLKVEKMF